MIYIFTYFPSFPLHLKRKNAEQMALMFLWLCVKVNIHRLCLYFVPEVVSSLVIPTSRRRTTSGSDFFEGCNERYNVIDVSWDAHKCKGTNLQSTVEERIYLYCGNAWTTQHMPKSIQHLAGLALWNRRLNRMKEDITNPHLI